MVMWEIPVQDVPPPDPLCINPFAPIKEYQPVIIDPNLDPELRRAMDMAAGEQWLSDEIILQQYDTKEEAESAYQKKSSFFERFKSCR